MDYFAHSDPDGAQPGDPGSKWQPLAVHLRSVASLAGKFAREAGANESLERRARGLGLLHDIGKYTPAFQRLLRGEVKKAPHSVYGAALAWFEGRAPDVAFAVSGHHAGMPDHALLRERIAAIRQPAKELLDVALADCPDIAACFQPQAGLLGPIPGSSPQVECATRILFSCLVDADRLDTAQNAGEHVAPPQPLDAANRLHRLLRMAGQRASSMPDGPVKIARASILDSCLKAAERPGSLFSLTVPTGGGKTIASMAFALRRATAFPARVRRVIVVIPYLSIIEQNAQVYREALGDDAVLEHHSGIWRTGDEDDEQYRNPRWRLATENWDAPVIVTTSVRFFEALFSNRPGDLRRMHNIANSVVILDEVQTLPRERVAPILSMTRGLAEQWGTTFVCCTATQPAFEKPAGREDDPRWTPGTLDEIIPDAPALFSALRRVEVRWPAQDEVESWDEVAAELSRETQALVVVNLREHALKLFRKLAPQGGHILHLSNNMCPAHRLERLAAVRERLKRGEACILVSTQLVEAGVDLDFPAVWRALGPLDSITQAAGRCDREGHLTQQHGRPGGRVVVFRPEDDRTPPGAYREASAITAAMAAAGGLSIDDPAIIRAYFDRYYSGALDADGIEQLRLDFKFQTVADNFRMIDDATRSVIVPYDPDAAAMLRTLSFGAIGSLRRLQRYTVNLWRNDFDKGCALGAIYRVIAGKDVWAARPGFYDEQIGLRLEPSSDQLVL